ncbi:MAG: 50S ribosomal protein L4 [Bacteroidetes bacterium]|nr:MAG: 50S ribosomal protein L4 [Bacteroidota bacterium]
MEVAVYNIKGEDTGKKIELKDSIFAIEPNDHSIYLDVKQFLANKRQGTHKSKEISDLTRSTKKIKRQKGTGTARAGSAKSPVMVGGARAFGPQPRNYSFKLNKKLKKIARKSALSYKAKDNKIFVVEDFNLDVPKTKELLSVKSNLKINDKKILFVLPEANKNIYLSSRNLKNTNVVLASELATYQIMNTSVLLFVEGSISVIEKILEN